MHISEWALPAKNTVNIYSVHKYLWEAFPGIPQEKRPFVFRFDKATQTGYGKVLMLSSIEPSSTGSTELRLLRSSKFTPSFVNGQRLLFSLRANPVRMLNHDKNRVPLIRHEDILDWLSRKLEDVAEITYADIAGRKALYFKKGSRSGKIVAVDFHGLLSVTNSDRFLEIMLHGVGPAKGFGCGLLLARRA
ncbi:MAG: type I-E CRISPR-associated protein Cas6/Cse3/CasE [Thermodesulfobacteriota bacterium]